jgi:hypothetical protein
MEDNLFDIEAARELPGVPDKERPLGVVPNERSMFKLRLNVGIKESNWCKNLLKGLA